MVIILFFILNKCVPISLVVHKSGSDELPRD